MRKPIVSVAALVLGAASFAGLAGPAHAAPNDSLWSKQYGPRQIHATSAWAKATGKGVKVAVVDTGVDSTHPDLVANLLPADGINYGRGDASDFDDKDGHGTHVAGTIAAVTNNGAGVAGVAPDAKIIPIRLIAEGAGEKSTPTESVLVKAIRHGVNKGAKVINLSLDEAGQFALAGLAITKDSVVTGCEEAYTKGALCIVAAGNSGADRESEYSDSFRAVVVTANDSKEKQAPFGQQANTVWSVTAPGVAVHSTLPEGRYGDLQGTSMATPHVAGVAALLFQQGLTNKQVAERLVSTAKPLGSWAGSGLVDAAAAVGAPVLADDTAGPAASGGGRPNQPSRDTVPRVGAPSLGTGGNGGGPGQPAGAPGADSEFPEAGAPDTLPNGDGSGITDLPEASEEAALASTDKPSEVDPTWVWAGVAGLLLLLVAGWTTSVAGTEKARRVAERK